MQKTFQEVCTVWCDAKQSIVKHSTMCAYMLVLHTHLLPRFGEMKEITEDDVQRFILDKYSAGLSKKTIRDIVAVLKSVAKYGSRRRIFPYQEWYLEYPKGEKVYRLPVLALRHQKLLMHHLLQNPTSHNIGILLALCTGMRIGEVCALKWEDVDFGQRVITVTHTVGRVYNCVSKSTEKIVSTPKTKNSSRDIPISNELFKSLKAVKKDATSPYVVGSAGKSTEPRAYRDYFSRLLKRLGIPPLVFHGLRHTFATRCIESQCDIKTVSVILGHSNVATTLNLYVHPNISQKKRCIERMSKFIAVPE